jgi:hypothetical protein
VALTGGCAWEGRGRSCRRESSREKEEEGGDENCGYGGHGG